MAIPRSISKVTICHKTGSTKNPCVTICVDESAVAEHMAHGDFMGSCNNSCTAPIANARTIGDAVESNENSTIEVYPNPVKSSISIRLANPANENVLMNMMDATGRSVILKDSAPSPDRIHQLNTEQLPAGLYILQVKVGNFAKTVKLMKE